MSQLPYFLSDFHHFCTDLYGNVYSFFEIMVMSGLDFPFKLPLTVKPMGAERAADRTTAQQWCHKKFALRIVCICTIFDIAH